MPRDWDDSVKRMVRVDPQAFIRFLCPSAAFVKEHSGQFKKWQLEVDALLEVEIERERVLFHLEFQTYRDEDMPDRLLRYNILARGEYKKPVTSFVVYLLHDGSVPQAPLILFSRGMDGQSEEIARFSYHTVEISQLSQARLVETGLPSLLPLLPLTLGGNTRETVEQMFAEIGASEQVRSQQEELEFLGFMFATLAFKYHRQKDQIIWLQGRFSAMHDILRQTPLYEWILDEGREEGIVRGREEGREEGLHQSILNYIHVRYPHLDSMARQQLNALKSAEQLTALSTNLFAAATEQDAHQLLEHISVNFPSSLE